MSPLTQGLNYRSACETVVMAVTVAKTVNGSSSTQRSLTLMSYNMHGLNQGRTTVIDFRDCVDIFMLQDSGALADSSKYV